MGGSNYRETYLTDYTNILDQEVDGERGGGNLFFKVGTEYFMDLKNIFGLNFTFSDGNRTHDQTVMTEETDEEYLEYERINDGIREFNKIDVAASYNRKFKNPKQALIANVHYSNSENFNEDEKYTEPHVGYEDLVDIALERTQTDNKYGTLDKQVDYVHPLGENSKLEVGYKGTDRSIDNIYDSYEAFELSSEEVQNEEESNYFLYSENIQAVYSVYSLQKELWGFQLGLRSEIVETKSELRDTGEKLDNSYTSLFPSIAISFGPQQVFQTQISYSKRINRPSFRRLNPAIHSLDQYNQRMGNPFLKPEYIDIAELNFSKFTRGLSISVGGYYRHITDKIGYYRSVDREGVGTTTYKNMNSQDTYGLELVVSGSLGKKFRIMLNGNLFADEVNASDVFEEYDKTSTGFFGRMTGTWKINPTTEIMLMGFYRSPRDIPIGSIKSMSFTSLSAKKKLMDNKLAISLNIRDIFNTMGFGYKTYGDNYFQDATRKWVSQSIGLQLEYKFGSIEDRSSFNKNRSNGDENGMDDYELD
jgi:outer membrane receptor protein involved in Fe transport